VQSGAISGRVYHDRNNSAVYDAGEELAGVTLTLTGNDDQGVAVNTSTTTAADGTYSFTNLRPSGAGGYTITETQPLGINDYPTTTGTQVGAIGIPPVGTAALNAISAIVLPSGAAGINYNFREQASSLEGYVYRDDNDDGVMGGGEPGIPGVTVTLKTSPGGATLKSATTDANGKFVFLGLASGAYTLEETHPAGFLDGKETAGVSGGTVDNSGFDNTAAKNRISAINLAAATNATGYLFGERGGTLNGFVYVDADNSGAKDGGEPGIPGIEVTLSGTTAGGDSIATIRSCAATPANCKSTTDATGAFSFEGVPPGTYTLVENQNQVDLIPDANGAAKYIDGKETAGVAGGTVNNAYFGSQAIYNTISNVQVTSSLITANAGNIGGYLFGERLRPNSIGLALKPPIVSGYVYFDTSHSRLRGTAVADPRTEGWTITLTATRSDGVREVICSVKSDATGYYHIDNVACAPNYPLWSNGLPTTGIAVAGGGGATYQTFALSFANPGVNGLSTAPQSGGSVGTVDPSATQITAITLNPGDDIVEQNLPLDPSGVIYDSVTRAPVAGAVVEFLGPGGVAVPAACLVSGQNTVTTGTNGYYEFLLVNPVPGGCPGSGAYSLRVTQPAGYIPAPSTMIPACAAPLSVMAGLAVVQTGSLAPTVGTPLAAAIPGACPATSATLPIGAGTTQYFFNFNINFALPSANVINNHIPLDPALVGTIRMSKTTPMVNVTRGDLVPYTVTATNTLTGVIGNVNVVDRIPPGFRYRAGSATLNGVATEPTVGGRDLVWANQTFTAAQTKTWKLILVVGAGVGEGEYTNQAWSLNNLINSTLSNIAAATVRVIPDPTFDCSDIIGKVFDDRNANGFQDEGEPGIPNVRVVTARGLLVTTDAEGRFHVACAAIPQMDHGSNFIMKLDERTLPSGYRLTTENPRDVRVTRGKMVKLNFGATVHRVVRLELTAAAFAGEVELAPEWAAKLDAVVAQLKGRPSVLRISYAGGGGGAQARLDAVAARIKELWKTAEKEKDYPLTIETELEGAK